MDNEVKEMLNLILKGQEELKEDVSGLKEDVSGLKEDVSGLKQDVQKINIKLENIIEPKIQLVYENTSNFIDKANKIDALENKIEVLEHEHFAMKYTLNTLKQG